MKSDLRFGGTLDRGRPHPPCGPARPAVLRLAAGATALKDASRRASARWPRKNEAILDRGDARRLAMFRPGRENGTPAEPENIDCDRALANASATTNGAHLYVVLPGRVYRLRRRGERRRIPGCVSVFVSQGWGSVHKYPKRLRDKLEEIAANRDARVAEK